MSKQVQIEKTIIMEGRGVRGFMYAAESERAFLDGTVAYCSKGSGGRWLVLHRNVYMRTQDNKPAGWSIIVWKGAR